MGEDRGDGGTSLSVNHKSLLSGSCVIMDKEKMLLQYINRLEQTNMILLEGLKQCHTLLSSIAEIVPDPYGWQNLLNEFQEMIQAAEREEKKSGMAMKSNSRRQTLV